MKFYNGAHKVWLSVPIPITNEVLKRSPWVANNAIELPEEYIERYEQLRWQAQEISRELEAMFRDAHKKAT